MSNYEAMTGLDARPMSLSDLVVALWGISFYLLISSVIRRPFRGFTGSFKAARVEWRTWTLIISSIQIAIPSTDLSPRTISPAPRGTTILIGTFTLTWRRAALVADLHDVSVASPLATSSYSALTAHIPLRVALPGHHRDARVCVTTQSMRVRVYSSKRVPYFIQLLRRAVINAALLGTVARVDRTRMDVVFGAERAPPVMPAVWDEETSELKLNAYDGEVEFHSANPAVEQHTPAKIQTNKQGIDDSAFSCPTASNNNGHPSEDLRCAAPEACSDASCTHHATRAGRPGPLQRDAAGNIWAPTHDDLLVTHTAEGLVMHDKKERMYAIRALSALVRRRWSPDVQVVDEDGERRFRGSGVFELEVEDGRWLRTSEGASVRWAGETSGFSNEPELEVGLEPVSLLRRLRQPMSIVDLHFVYARISFDRFRLRDAELSNHAFEAAAQFFGLSEQGDS